jgi:hypothetical protein
MSRESASANSAADDGIDRALLRRLNDVWRAHDNAVTAAEQAGDEKLERTLVCCRRRVCVCDTGW